MIESDTKDGNEEKDKFMAADSYLIKLDLPQTVNELVTRESHEPGPPTGVREVVLVSTPLGVANCDTGKGGHRCTDPQDEQARRMHWVVPRMKKG